jgi:hypothetical protein
MLVGTSVSGFIGLPAAQAFIHTGHIVYGPTHSEEKAKLLTADESKLDPVND